MFPSILRNFLSTLFLIGLTLPSAVAQDKTNAAPIEAARQKAIGQYKQRQAIQGELNSFQEEVRNLKKSLATMTSMQADLKKQLAEVQKKLTEQETASTASSKKLSTATTAEKTAQTALEAAQKKLVAAKTASATAKKDADAKLAAVKASKESLAGIQKTTADLTTKSITAVQTLKQTAIKINEKDAVLKSSAKAENEHWKQVEKLHTEAGTWVSFAKEIAPMFQKRCLACHNEGKPRGQLKMDNYNVLLHGGESGALVDLEKPELSTLIAMIEDGSMPKDDDPLTQEQIATVTKWISMGARLDAGLNVTSPLIEIMPRPSYLTPPKEYPAPIPVNAIALHQDGIRVVTSGYHELLIWSTENGELTRRIPGVAERVYDLAFMGKSNLIAAATGTPGEVGEVKIFDINTGSMIKSLHVSAAIITGLDFSSDDTHLATCGADGAIHIFDTATWNKTLTIHDHGDWVNDIAWSPDGTKIASASRDKTSKVFDVKTGNNIMTFNGHNNVVTAITFLLKGEEIATGGDDRRLRIWKIADASEVRNVAGFGGAITSLKLLEDGKLLSAATDKKIRIHAAADHKIEKTLIGPTAELLSLDVVSSPLNVASGSLGGEVHMWSLDQDKPIRNWLAKPAPAPVVETPKPEATPDKKEDK